MTPSTALTNEEYFVATTPLTTPAFDDFVLTPSYCEISYAIKITPALIAPDDTAIVFDALNR